MSKLTVEDLVQAQQSVDTNLKRIAALMRDDLPKPMSKVSHYVIILTYFCLFLFTIRNLAVFSDAMNNVKSAPQEASAAATFAAMTILGYVLARCVELAFRARDRF